MPECIYCKTEKPPRSFDAEHVLSRGLCGAGVNWTLIGQVCRTCNRRFSAFEAHWMRQAIEATARNFLGPAGRSGAAPGRRAQPVEIDHVYIVNAGDSTVYEAGFAFPNDHHFLPQIVETDGGLLPVASSQEDGAALMAALGALDWRALELTVPRWHERHDDWLIAEFGPLRSVGWTLRSISRAPHPRGMWLRSFPHATLLNGNRVIDSDHTMSTRIALDPRGRLYVRAANLEVVPRFLTRVASNDLIRETAPRTVRSGGQRVLFGLELDLVKIFLAVLKTGLNLFAHLFGADMARHPTFDDVRDLLLADPTDRVRV